MRFATAIGVSVALHGVLAAGLVAYMKYAPGPTAVATLDLSSVDLSFADEDDENAAVAPSMPSPPPAEPPAPPEERPPEPELEKPSEPMPPEPDAFRPPEPDQTEPLPEPSHMEPPRTSDEVAKAPSTSEAQAPSASEAQAPKQAKVDAPPKPRKTIRPDYPKGARQRGEQGDVVLEIRVGADGLVDYVSVVESCGHSELDEAAVRAAKAAHFTPAKAGGRSVASTARLTLTFRLR